MHPPEEVPAILGLSEGEIRVSEKETARHQAKAENPKTDQPEIPGKRGNSNQREAKRAKTSVNKRVHLEAEKEGFEGDISTTVGIKQTPVSRSRLAFVIKEELWLQFREKEGGLCG